MITNLHKKKIDLNIELNAKKNYGEHEKLTWKQAQNLHAISSTISTLYTRFEWTWMVKNKLRDSHIWVWKNDFRWDTPKQNRAI